MSYSVSFKGTPAQVTQQLQDESNRQTGQSKEEYDNALPHLLGLVAQNTGYEGRMIEISAYGHGLIENGIVKYSSCTVKLQEHDPLV